MPRISAYYGIAIYMYYQDHAPPHFHAIYGEQEATVKIATGKVMEGDLPKRALKLVREWASVHRDELQENWQRAPTVNRSTKLSHCNETRDITHQ